LCFNDIQESIIAASLEFVRLEEKVGDVSRQLSTLQRDIEGCIRGAQVAATAAGVWGGCGGCGCGDDD
jgi:hypothetical protein